MKHVRPLSTHKSVRIDRNTVILVKREIPDDIARNNYLNNVDRSFRLTQKCGIVPPRRKEKAEAEIELPDIEKEVDEDDQD